MSAILDLLSAPGDYTRGLLTGRLGERVGPGELASAWGLGDSDTPLAGLRDFGLGVITDPLTYAGSGLGAILGKGILGARAAAAARAAGEAAPAATGLGRLLPLRRGFALADELDRATPSVAGVVRGGGGAPDVLVPKATGALWREIGKDTPESRTMGMYFPTYKAAALNPQRELDVARMPMGGARVTDPIARHETMHGLIDMARTGESSAGLGPVARAAAWMGRGAEPGTSRWGGYALLDELAAHMAEGQGPISQTLRGGKFLLGGDPAVRAWYAQDLARHSPLLGALYRRAPEIAVAGTAGGVGAGTIGTTYLLSGGGGQP